jgi:hypothetical protein
MVAAGQPRDFHGRIKRPVTGRGLLAKLPTYVKGETDDLQFARKLDVFTGRWPKVHSFEIMG